MSVKYGKRNPVYKSTSKLIESMKIARLQAEKGKSIKYIAKASGLTLTEADAIKAAYTGAAQRKSNKEILSEMLNRFRALFPLAESAYRDSPTGYNARAMAEISFEIRAILSNMQELSRPEAAALDVIQNGLQPFIKDLFRDITVEARKARAQCIAVSPDQRAEREIRNAFDRFLESIGVASKERYGEVSEKIGIALKCDLQELRKLARDSKSEIDDIKEAEDYSIKSLRFTGMMTSKGRLIQHPAMSTLRKSG